MRMLVRSLLAGTISYSRVDGPARRMLARRFGGYVLAFHDVQPERFCELVESLRPDQPVPLDELVDRLRAGRSTAGLFAITVDDGVGEPVRALASAARQRAWPLTFYLPTAYLDDPAAGMPFQWFRAILPHLCGRRFFLESGTEDFSAPRSVEAFEAEMTRTMHTKTRQEYEARLSGLTEALRRDGRTASIQHPPAPITWEEVAQLSRIPGLRFESHGVTHSALSAMSPSEVEKELAVSRARIEEHTGVPCRHFCYPFGGPESIGPDVPRLVAKYYLSGVTMSRGRIRASHPCLLPRIPLYQRDDGAVARLKVITR